MTDQRNVTYVDPKHRAKFPGLGRKLDDESKYKGLKVLYWTKFLVKHIVTSTLLLIVIDGVTINCLVHFLVV